MIKVSIIVPVYNVEKYIERCLDSLVNQTLDSCEIILVNDGSPDNSEKIIKRYQKKYPDKIVYLTKENGGQASARNLGIQYAKGEFLGFVDSDDYVELDMFEKLYKKAKKTKSDIVSCNYKNYYENENRFEDFDLKISGDLVKEQIMKQPALWNKIFKRKIFIDNDLKLPEGIIYEDYALTPLIAPLAKNIAHIEEPLYIYIIRDNSTMNQPKFNKKFHNIVPATNFLYNQMMKRIDIYGKYYSEYEYTIICNLLVDAYLRVRQFEESKYIVDDIADWLKNNMPKWYKNKYFKKNFTLKQRIFNYLVYKKKYNLVGFGRKK